MDNKERIDRIERLIKDELSASLVEIIDDSHHHAGHKGSEDGAGHFTLIICAEQFEGKTLVERHRMIYRILHDMLNKDIHALSIQAYTAKEKEENEKII